MVSLNNLDWRRERLTAAVEKLGGKAALGRALGYKDGAFVGQMLRPYISPYMAAADARTGRLRN
jgi:hypothetical protein